MKIVLGRLGTSSKSYTSQLFYNPAESAYIETLDETEQQAIHAEIQRRLFHEGVKSTIEYIKKVMQIEDIPAKHKPPK